MPIEPLPEPYRGPPAIFAFCIGWPEPVRASVRLAAAASAILAFGVAVGDTRMLIFFAGPAVVGFIAAIVRDRRLLGLSRIARRAVRVTMRTGFPSGDGRADRVAGNRLRELARGFALFRASEVALAVLFAVETVLIAVLASVLIALLVLPALILCVLDGVCCWRYDPDRALRVLTAEIAARAVERVQPEV